MVFLPIFLFGLVIGSFLNVLIYRLPNNLGILGRSFCPNCKKKISWYDNIPLFSFVFLKGKCRQCYSPISFQYPLVEFATGALFVFTFWWHFQNQCQMSNVKCQMSNLLEIGSIGNYLTLVIILYVVSSLIIIFFTDLKYGIIPNVLVYSSTLGVFLYLILNTKYLILNTVSSAFDALIFFLILFLITRGKGMGLGDVKLAFLMGLFLGFPKIVVALYIAFLTGAVISLILVLWGKKKFKGGTVAFGPFLVFGTLVGFFAGESLIQVFFSLFLR